ncbi:MAG: hypothetical protein K6E70_13645 [Butyrivibrio sp.]|nr:hypothetical protein [Butyrivibrio sp.]
MTKWDDRYIEKAEKLPERLKEDWELVTSSLRGEHKLAKGTLELWRKELKGEE